MDSPKSFYKRRIITLFWHKQQREFKLCCAQKIKDCCIWNYFSKNKLKNSVISDNRNKTIY